MNQPFYFPDGRAANNAKDLLELCEQYPDEATGFLVRHDLENWLAYIGSYDVAECAANARQIEAEDRQKLEDFLQKYHSLNASTPVPTAAPEPNIQDNLTAPDTTTVTETEVAILEEKPFQEVSIEETSAKETPAEKTLEEATPPAAPPQPATPAATPAATSVSDVSSSSTNSAEKPSFFQVVAKLIVNVLYRDKT